MADDEVVKLVGNLNDLNSVSYKAGLEFQGLTKRLIKMSDTVSGSGKKWTIFSRIVSGSPIWKIQNKIRAIIDSLAMMQEASKKNTEEQKKADEQVMNLVKSQEVLTKKITEGVNIGKTEIQVLAKKSKEIKALIETEKERTALGKRTKKANTARLTLGTKLRKNNTLLNDEQREAVKNTLAYNKALLLGKEPIEAYADGMEEIVKKAKQMEETFQDAQKAAKFAEGTKIRGPLDQDKRKESFGIAKEEVKKDREKMKKGFALFGKSFKKDDDEDTPIGKRIGALLTLQKKRQQLANFSLKYQKFMMGIGKMARPLMSYAFNVLIYLMLGIVAFLAIAKVIYEAYGLLQDFGVIDDIMLIGYLVFDSIKMIIKMAKAVISGDIYQFMEYGEALVKNIISIGILAIIAFGKTMFALAVAIFYSLFDFIEKMYNDPDFRRAVGKIIIKAGLVLLAALVVKWYVIKMMEIAAIYALPLLITVLILAGVAALIKKFKIGGVFDTVKKAGFAALTVIGETAIGLGKGAAGAVIPRAMGGVVNENTTLVGERGPELVSLPRGSRVHTNAKSRGIGGSVVNNVNITINAKDTSDAELRRIADQVGNMITNKLNRTTSSSGFVR